jgi:D-beta-D-heptose 7-phosphate kinase / D-beta-D-heptose 1-phosphate adenosyltransferase
MDTSLFFTPSPVKILALGDVMLDRYIYGNVERISPEAPVPVFHSRKIHFSLGGVGNVIRNLADLNANCSLMALCGDDLKGTELKNLLSVHANINTYLAHHGRTICKTRYISGGQQLMRVDEEQILPLPHHIEQDLEARLAQTIHQYQAIILSDYAKGFLTPTLCQKVITLAQKHGIPVIADPKGKNYHKYRGATLITPNLKELSDIAGHKLQTDQEIIQAATELLNTLELSYVLVTRSAEGMTLVKKGERSHHIPTNAREVYDVSGAGDTVIATLTIALAKGLEIETACRIANTAAGIVVGKAGTATIHPEELEKALLTERLHDSEQKIHTLQGLMGILQTWRHHGYKIGFTNGCFDLLHAGHIHSLKASKATCDRLIVGLNSDASIQRLKGKDRPIQTEDVRALVLSALEVVDAVVLFEEDTPLGLIQAIKPDLLIKGADYTIDQVIGADIVLQHGGRVELIDLKPGFSTTKTIEKLKKISA